VPKVSVKLATYLFGIFNSYLLYRKMIEHTMLTVIAEVLN